MRAPLAGLVVAACALASPSCVESPAAPDDGWRFVVQDHPGALLSAWGLGPDDVWVIGADTLDGAGPQVWRFDGTAWRRLATGVGEGDLWWAHGFAGGPTFVGGEGGVILRFEGDTPTPMATPDPGATVFGIWGAAADDLWAVGRKGTSPARGFVWRGDGQTWTDVPLPAQASNVVVVNKVWGASAGDVTFVGAQGLVMRWDGAALVVDSSDDSAPLFTCAGTADGGVVTAVGGQLEAIVLERTGGGPWLDVTPGPPRPARMVGVHYDATGQAYAVGDDLAILHKPAGGAWTVDPGPPMDGIVSLGLHAVWLDGAGGAWAAGWQIIAPPFVDGLLLYKGPAPPPALPGEGAE